MNLRSVTLRLTACASAGLLLAACSIEGLIQRGLSQIEGVDSVDWDFGEEGGGFRITSDEGEVLSFEGDAEGRSTMTTPEGTVTTTVTDDIPSEVTSAVDLPGGLTQVVVTEMTTSDGDAVAVQAEVQGDFDTLLDDLEASLASRWGEVQRVVMAPGIMANLVAGDPDGDVGVTVALIFEEDRDEGMLQVMVFNP